MKKENVGTVYLVLLTAVVSSGVLSLKIDINSASSRSLQVHLEKYDVGNISRIERKIQKEHENLALVFYRSRLPEYLEHKLVTITRVANVKLVDLDEDINKKHRHYLMFLFDVGNEGGGKASLLVFFTENNKMVRYTADGGELRKVSETLLSSFFGNPFSFLNYHLIGNYVYYFFNVAYYVKSLQFSTIFSHNNQMYTFVCGVGSAFAVLTVLVLIALNFNVDQLSDKERSIAGNKVRVSHPTQIVSTTKNHVSTIPMRSSSKSSQHLIMSSKVQQAYSQTIKKRKKQKMN